MALDANLLLADDLAEFEALYLQAMVNKRDSIWELMKESTTPEAQEKYTELNNKVRFLEGLLKNMRAVSSQDAVIVHWAQEFIEAFESGKASQISKALNKLKEVVR